MPDINVCCLCGKPLSDDYDMKCPECMEKEKGEREIAPGQILKDRYIPIEDSQDVLGVSKEYVQSLIDSKKIRYAEFHKPGSRRRSVHVDPVEIRKVLTIQ